MITKMGPGYSGLLTQPINMVFISALSKYLVSSITRELIIGCVSKPLYPGPILVIMPGGGGGGGGANLQLNTPPRRMKIFKNQVCRIEASILNWVYV